MIKAPERKVKGTFAGYINGSRESHFMAIHLMDVRYFPYEEGKL